MSENVLISPPFTNFFILFSFITCLGVCFACIYVCVPCAWGQERASDPLELELPAVVSHRAGVSDQTWVLW